MVEVIIILLSWVELFKLKYYKLLKFSKIAFDLLLFIFSVCFIFCYFFLPFFLFLLDIWHHHFRSIRICTFYDFILSFIIIVIIIYFALGCLHLHYHFHHYPHQLPPSFTALTDYVQSSFFNPLFIFILFLWHLILCLSILIFFYLIFFHTLYFKPIRFNKNQKKKKKKIICNANQNSYVSYFFSRSLNLLENHFWVAATFWQFVTFLISVIIYNIFLMLCI